MANLVVYRGTNAHRKALIVERSGYSAHFRCDVIHPLVDLSGRDSRLDMLGYKIEHGDVYLCAFLDFLDLLRGFYNIVIGNDVAFSLDLLDPLVKINVTFFILLSAAAPSSVISTRLFHNILINLDIYIISLYFIPHKLYFVFICCIITVICSNGIAYLLV